MSDSGESNSRAAHSHSVCKATCKSCWKYIELVYACERAPGEPPGMPDSIEHACQHCGQVHQYVGGEIELQAYRLA